MDLIGRVRGVLPAEARVLGNRLRPSSRAERSAVAAAMELPPSLTRQRRRRGSVWAVGMMRDEVEVAQHVVEHLLAQGVDDVLVSDNLSADGTGDVLRSLAATHPVHVVRDSMAAYLQETKMALLVAQARRSGADWIVPFDADELWFARDGSVGSFLRASSAVAVWAQVHNVFPRPDDDPDEPDPFLRLRGVDVHPAHVRKIAYRPNAVTRLDMGAVDLLRRGPREDGLFVAHYPWRSLEHMTRKLRQGREAVDRAELRIELATHWRTGGAWSDDRLAAAWADLEHGRPVGDLGWSPVGPIVPGEPGTWERWQWPPSAPNLGLERDPAGADDERQWDRRRSDANY